MRKPERKRQSRLTGIFSLESMEARWLMSSTLAQWTFTGTEKASTALISPSSGTTGVAVVNGQTAGTPKLTAIGMAESGTADSEDITPTAGTAVPTFSESLWRIRGSGTGTNGNTNGWSLQAPEYTQGAEIDLNTTGYSNLNALTFDWYSTTSGVKDMMVQYNLNTTNASGWTNLLSAPLVATSNDYYGGAGSSPTNTIDLSGIAGSANDPNFGIRLVSAYDPNFPSSTQYSAANSANSGTQTLISNTGGNWRFGNITVTGTLGVAEAPVISTNPLSQTVAAGSQVTLTANATGNPAPTVQWQISTNGDSTFTSISGATSATYSYIATEATTGDVFQAVFTNAAGSATTTPATVIVAGTPITQWLFTAGEAPTPQSTVAGTANSPYPSLAGSPTDSANTLGLQNDYAGTQSFPEADILAERSTVNPNFNEYIWRVRGGSGLGPTGSPGTPDGWSQNAPEYSQGVVFAVNTTGYSNITLQFDLNQGGIADMQPQYSPDGGNTWINVGSVIQASSNDYYGITASTNPTGVTVDLQGITAANNNPNFQLRLVAAYDPNLPMITDGNELDPTVHGQYASAGFGPANAEQVLTLGSQNNFQLTFNGQTTGTITYDDTPGSNFTYTNMATNIANALTPILGAGNFTVTAADQTGTRFMITFTGALAHTAEPNMSSSDPNASVQTWVNGTDSPTGVTRYVDGGGSWQLGNISFNGDKITGAPGITQQPVSTTVTAGTTATFTAAAYSELNPLSVQWEVSTNGGQSYQPISGANQLTGSTSIYSFTTNPNRSDSGDLFEAVFTNPGGCTSTIPATLTAVAPVSPSVTEQPNNTSVQAGNVAIFTAAATGSPPPTVQWQINTGSGWSNLSDSTTVSGSTNDTLQYTTNANGSENGDQFRAVFTNSGSSVISNPATMTVLAAETVITDWDFDQYANGAFSNSPAPTGGVADTGTASMVGMTLAYNPSDPATGTDGNGSVPAGDITSTPGDLNPNFSENTWRIRGGPTATTGGTPANGWSNFAPEYTQGVQFSVPTTGFTNVYVTMDWYTTTSGILDAQEQYTLDGVKWVNIGPEIQGVSNDFYGATATGAPVPLVIDVSAIAGANNNPNFGIRLVSAYDPDLPLVQNPNDPGNPNDLVGQYANAALVGSPPEPAPYNGSKGNWRFDNIVFHGEAIAPVSVLNGNVSNSATQTLNLQFSSNVGASLAAGDLQIKPVAGGSPVTANALSYDSSSNTATFSFSSPLASGIYKATLPAVGIQDASGNYLTSDYTFEFLLLNNGDTLALTGSKTYTLQQMLLGAGSTLDIGNDILVDQYTSGSDPAAAISSAITAGYNNGQWNAPGIISSAAADDATHSTGVGYFDSGSSITIARTWYGDANVDGVINADDLSLIMLGQTTSGTLWQDGDFSYHNTVNADDWMKLFTALAYSNGQSVGGEFNTQAQIQSPAAAPLANFSLAAPVAPAFSETPLNDNNDLNDLLE